jgi:hypothetical protein
LISAVEVLDSVEFLFFEIKEDNFLKPRMMEKFKCVKSGLKFFVIFSKSSSRWHSAKSSFLIDLILPITEAP